ncbi:ABC transporter permease [Acidobacteriota bacterium]
MFQNYLKIALRNIKRHKGYSFINIAGLSLGLACCLLLLTYIRHELSYDTYHEKTDRIFRVAQENPAIPANNSLFAITPAPLAQTLKQDFPEVESAARIYRAINLLLSRGDQKFFEKEVHFIDPELFDVFSIPMVEGGHEILQDNPNTLLISERAADKYFGNESPIGKVITLENQDDFLVGGVMRNFPENSHFKMDFAAPFALVHKKFKSWLKEMNVWWHIDYYTYILLAQGSDPAELERKFQNMIQT